MIRALLRIIAVCAASVLGIVFLLGGLLGAALHAGANPASSESQPRDRAADERHRTRRTLRLEALLGVLGLFTVGGIIGVLVLVSGIVPINASSGHWTITEWFLNFAKQRSVSTQSIGIKVPALDDPDLVLKGAVHYEVGCRSCHGSPGMEQPRIPHQMTPNPPNLSTRSQNWHDGGLFHIVKHGIKFTGMPAWPAMNRDDEVWAVVAFLRKLPRLDAAGYRRLIDGDSPQNAPIETMGLAPGTARAVLQNCARCHGHNGVARGNGAFPHLAGQRPEYLKKALEAYARGSRHSGMMQPIAAGLTPETLEELARYYARLTPPKRAASETMVDHKAIQLGGKIALEGLRDRRIPACIECHEPEGRRAKPSYPKLYGQPADYLLLQLELFKKRHRGGSEYAHLMHEVVDRLGPEQMRAVALYFESLSEPKR